MRAHLRCRHHQQRRQTGPSALRRRTTCKGRPGTDSHCTRLAVTNQAAAGCMVSVSPIRAAGHARRFQPQRRKPSDLNSIHLEQWHLRSSLPGISKWPHLAQTNAPSASAIIGMNSLPTTQYGHRSTRSVIAAAPLAVEVRNEGTKTRASRSHPRTTRVERNVTNYSQSTRQQ